MMSFTMMDTKDDRRMLYVMLPPPSTVSRLTLTTVEVTLWVKDKDGSWHTKGQSVQTLAQARDHWNYLAEEGWRRIP